MENKINVAELLKDCPRGMELDCAIYENVTLVEVKEGYDYPIVIETPNGQMLFSKYGCFSKNELAKCVIFPKGKTTWVEFEPPHEFKDGDIVTWKDSRGSLVACIYKERLDISFSHHIALYKGGLGIIVNGEIISTNDELCLATEEEKKKLFKAIKDNGYKWNPETKTLEKLPKFKVGNKIIKKNGLRIPFVITGVSDVYYWSNTENSVEVLPVADQDDWELVPTKFDVTTLKPFDKVLVRGFGGVWGINLFGFYDGNQKEYPFYCIGQTSTGWNQCVPYEGNEHLLRTTNDCDDFYKTWE